MSDAPEPATCPHCGAEPGPLVFCQACGNRVRWKTLGPTGRAVVRGGLVLLAVPALLIGGAMALCGLLGAVGGTWDDAFLGLLFVALGFGLGWLALAMLRHAHEVLEGDPRVGFGEGEP